MVNAVVANLLLESFISNEVAKIGVPTNDGESNLANDDESIPPNLLEFVTVISKLVGLLPSTTWPYLFTVVIKRFGP